MQRKHNKEIVALAKTLRKNMTKEDLHKGHNPSVSSADSSLYTRVTIPQSAPLTAPFTQGSQSLSQLR